ncbi:MAG: DNA repair protein RecO [Burkholderiales bacterium]|nr:DNA repair protein RecO [Burkholderiales bacterium]
MATTRAPAAPLAAYVLHRYDWSETSLIVELFTRERGRIVVAAKGAKRPHSQLRPVLLPFQRLAVQLGRTPADEAAEVHLLRSAEWAGGAPSVAGAALYSGFYMNELLLKLLARQDPHERLFDAYGETLAALADEAPALRAFELVLLRETGVLPELDVETLTLRPAEAERRYALHPESGLVPDAEGLRGSVWAALEAGLRSASRAELRAACTPFAGALRGPLRKLLHYHLGSAKLRTRQVMLELQKLAEPA